MNIKDLGVAAFLCAKDMKIIRLEGGDKFGEKVFIFEDSEKLDNLLKDYWAGESRVEPKRFWQEARNLKSRVNQNY